MFERTFGICYARSPSSLLISFQLGSCYRDLQGIGILNIHSEAQ